MTENDGVLYLPWPSFKLNTEHLSSLVRDQKNVDELKGSGFARVFGNELAYSRFQGMDSLTSGKTFNLLDFLINLSENHDYTFTQSIQVSWQSGCAAEVYDLTLTAAPQQILTPVPFRTAVVMI